MHHAQNVGSLHGSGSVLRDFALGGSDLNHAQQETGDLRSIMAAVRIKKVITETRTPGLS